MATGSGGLVTRHDVGVLNIDWSELFNTVVYNNVLMFLVAFPVGTWTTCFCLVVDRKQLRQRCVLFAVLILFSTDKLWKSLQWYIEWFFFTYRTRKIECNDVCNKRGLWIAAVFGRSDIYWVIMRSIMHWFGESWILS